MRLVENFQQPDDRESTFSSQRIERALSARVSRHGPLVRGAPRVSIRQRSTRAAPEAGTSMTTDAQKTVAPKMLRAGAMATVAPRTPAASSLSPPPVLTPDELAKRSELSRKRGFCSSGKGKGHADESHAKKHRVDVSSSAAVEEIVPRRSGGIGFCYLLFQALDNKVLEEEVKNKKDLDTKVEHLELDCAKDIGMIAKLRSRKAKEDMLDFVEIDQKLEFIEDIQKKKTKLEVEVERLEGQRADIYDAREVFKELLTEVMEVLGISDVGGETSIVQEKASEISKPTTAETSWLHPPTGADRC
ncbi:hypothetical protein AALP_AAs41740U000200 [Arabis alpina]|uniref:Uncharacterized protein n=1 Tax=Arabis alpina TaxID=50452 RepID=A0A087G000_ARAAL|nr:hypothetical protein AALP_AAs41740U000200 [Arabis alpina]